MANIFEQLNLPVSEPLNPKTVVADRTAIAAFQVYRGLLLYDTSAPSGVYVYAGVDGTNVAADWVHVDASGGLIDQEDGVTQVTWDSEATLAFAEGPTHIPGRIYEVDVPDTTFTTVPIGFGGTGAITAADARANLGITNGDVFPTELVFLDGTDNQFTVGQKNRIRTNTNTGNFTIGVADAVGDGADVSGETGTEGQVTVIQNQSGVSKTLIYKTGTGQPQLLPLQDDSFTQFKSNGTGWVIISRSVRQGGNIIFDAGNSLTLADGTNVATAADLGTGGGGGTTFEYLAETPVAEDVVEEVAFGLSGADLMVIDTALLQVDDFFTFNSITYTITAIPTAGTVELSPVPINALVGQALTFRRNTEGVITVDGSITLETDGNTLTIDANTALGGGLVDAADGDAITWDSVATLAEATEAGFVEDRVYEVDIPDDDIVPIGFGGTGETTLLAAQAALGIPDYQTGSWTPAADTNGNAFQNATGTFVKIGRLVTISAAITFGAQTSGSTGNVLGAPFVPSAQSFGTTIDNAGGSGASNETVISNIATTSAIRFARVPGSGSETYLMLNLHIFRFSITYETND